MKTLFSYLLGILSLFAFQYAKAQSCEPATDLEEYIPNKLSGHVNFTVIGNTQNPAENNNFNESNCNQLAPILTTSSTLDIPNGDNIVGAHLYWSGAGNPIQNVRLNNIDVSAERCWQEDFEAISFFSSYADVTDIVQNFGETTYTFTGLDNSSTYSQFRCNDDVRSVLYGGWALIVMLENENTYDDFTIFYYDGFRLFQNTSYEVDIIANVFDSAEGSFAGVIAWEGDEDSRIRGDDIRMNNVLLPSSGYEEVDNIFNGTNSFISPVNENLFNADFDQFNAEGVVEDQLNTPLANFNFRLTTGQDVILLNTILLRIPNQAPDATVEIDSNLDFACVDTRTFTIDYTYRNGENTTQDLPTNLPVNFYMTSENGEIEDLLIGSDNTSQVLGPGEEATGQAQITFPQDFTGRFTLTAYIDDPEGQANDFGVVLELLEENNTFDREGLWDTEYDFTDNPLQVSICDNERFVTSDNQIYTEPGTYPFTDTTTEVGECDSIGFFELTVHPTFDEPAIPEEICEGEPFTIADGETVELEPREQPYTFRTRLESIFGCDSIINQEVLVKPHGRAAVEVDICFGQTYILPGDETIEVSEPGEYTSTLVGQAANGCDSIITTTLNILDIVYPNAFMPNGNGNNDVFRAIQPRTCPLSITEYHLQIFNRWGELVFETFDVNDGWDGEFNDNSSIPDFYIWHVNYASGQGSQRQQSGGVTLLR